MRSIKRLFDFYVFANVHVALSSACLTKLTLYLFEITNNVLPLFVFFATLLSYNFIRMYRKTEIKSWLYDWIILNKSFIAVISFISMVGVIYFGLQLKENTIIAILPLGFLTFFYAVPLWKKRSLRILPGFKLVLIAFCWAAVTVLLPILNYTIAITEEIAIIFLQRVLFIMAITIPFDIRDVNNDHAMLKTIPQVFGITKAKRLGVLFLMLYLGLNFFKQTLPQTFRVELIVACVALLLLVRATSNQNKYYSAFFVEAIPILWFLLFILQVPFLN